MPVTIGRRGKKWCVLEPDGTVVDCYTEKPDALRRMRAMNANMEKSTNVENSGVELEPYSLAKGFRIHNEDYTMATNSATGMNVAIAVEHPMEDVEVKERPVDTEDKSGIGFTSFPPTSFSELDEMREAKKQDMSVQKVISDFMALVGNIMSFPSERGKIADLKGLIKEMQDRLPQDQEEDMPEDDGEEEEKEKWTTAYINKLPDSAFLFIEPGGEKDGEGKTTPRSLRHLPYKDADGKTDAPHLRNAIQRASQVTLADGSKISESKVSSIVARAKKLLESTKEVNTAETKTDNRFFTIWKDEATGEYLWFGIYSNKFRDNDTPAEILAEKAHLRFIERVEKGELEYPDLYIWHIPVPIGKANLLAYDDGGFSIASGTVEEEFAIALMNTSEDLAMSHGMPTQYVRREDVDKTVITDYVSTEVSVLPRFAAANKMTDFHVLDEEEAKMAIIPDNKRQQVAAFLGDKLTEEIEARLSEQSDKAIAEGIEFKEENEAVEVTNEELTEAEDQKTEQSEPEVKEELEESVAEAEDVAEESVEQSDAGDAEDVSVEDTSEEEQEEIQTLVEKEELAETLAAIVETVTQQNTKVLEAVQALGQRVDALENGVGELKEADDTKIAQLAASTPEVSLAALLAGKLASTQSVIGNKATLVGENDKLAKEGPVETPHNEEETKEGYAGLFFSGWQR